MVSATHSSSGFNLSLTPRGWQEVEDLTRRKSSPQHPAFVAMWFGETEAEKREMMTLYEEGIAPAVRAAGYRVRFLP